MAKAPNTSCHRHGGNEEEWHEDQEPEVAASLNPVAHSTSNISNSKWMPTAISMALNSTHVSPSALKRDRRRRKKHPQFKISIASKQPSTPTYTDTLDCICKSDKRQREIRWKAKLTFLFKGQSFKHQRTTT